MRSIASVVYVAAFLCLLSYIFAIVGVTIFGRNDPFSFGTLGRALTTLFRVATLEGWTPIMYTQVYGCEGIGLGVESYLEFVDQEIEDCTNEPFPVIGRVYFMLYIMLASYVMLNLFIGVIVNSMMEMRMEDREKLLEEQAWAVATRMQGHNVTTSRKENGNVKQKSKRREMEKEFGNPLANGDGADGK